MSTYSTYNKLYEALRKEAVVHGFKSMDEMRTWAEEKVNAFITLDELEMAYLDEQEYEQ